MKIEVLYFPGCPHRYLAIEEMERAMTSENVQAAITEIEVRDAREAELCKFSGSPTIRINDRDVDPPPPGTTTFRLQCRLYPGSEHPGIPSRDSLCAALRGAVNEERQ